MNSKIYDDLRVLVDEVLLGGKDSIKSKDDGTFVTSSDLRIEQNAIAYFKDISPKILVIAEESYDGSLSWDLSKGDYLILDPIDGTENYAFINALFGFVASWRINGIEGNMIYIPRDSLVLNDVNLSNRISVTSNIRLFSTKCKDQHIGENRDNIRIIGSSSYMFSLVIRGMANSYMYCQGAKIWDCFTGLKMCSALGLRIEGMPNNYFVKPTFKQEFKVSWK